MIDQAGNKLEANKGYTLTFYYHSDTEIKQTNDLSKTGLYTVVARPNQANYKSGVTMKFEVVNDATTYTPAAEPKPSTLITISNTAELYGNTGNTGVQTSFTNSATLFKIEYQNGANWTKTRPTDAGRYLLKVTATTATSPTASTPSPRRIRASASLRQRQPTTPCRTPVQQRI